MKVSVKRGMIFLAVLFLLQVCMGLAAAEAAGDDGVMREDLTAIEATRLMGNGINLGNTMEACNNSRGRYSMFVTDYETMWGQPVTTQAMLDAMKAAGFDTLRLPVAWITNATAMPRDYTIDAAYLARVKQIVNYARNAGMYVIINDHWDGGWWGMFGSEDPETAAFAMEAYRGMWRQIAEYFKDYSDYVIFESANEELGARFDEDSPLFCKDSIVSYLTDDERFALTNEVNQVFVDTVRATGGNNAGRFLLIAGYGTAIDSTLDRRFQMPADTAERKLMVSVHYYNPWSYCGASSAKGATRWGLAKDYDEMLAVMSPLSAFTEQGYGVVIGEYGALPADDGFKDNAVAYHKAFLDCCDALDLTSCLWDCSGYFNRRKLEMADPDMAALYAGRNVVAESGKTPEEITAAGLQSLEDAKKAAPASFRTDAIELTDDTCVAWIMWNSGDWAQSYSVGDIYTPESITPGLKVTDVVINESGDYTVALDFTGTDKGYSNSVAFSAIGIANGEKLHPGWCVHIVECLINGEPYTFKGRPYTTSDDGVCTRVNLFNEWVTAVPDTARVLYGPPIGVSAQPLDRNDPALSRIETLTVTFRYAPRQ
ncbi:MAG: glycoside hydrolase family 5 protein [Clostridia bacterium]|nr:glycoside hydrolase family 5 protein [Clostridia bacterium]